MTKKCKCGREIEDRWDECYTCKKKAETPTDTRTASIERQVAAKCAAAILNGHPSTENEIGAVFNVFLRLIRG